ncbi:EAL domain-containing protein [Gallaecimonas sp. GXIMD4217]|uniref:bifunctional diguanylate cyclase/phosphodiesterase n=1 Tax=Gallaecimonas sp. GXIMD4217 TaxID=3131927 RepID=UPI00311B093B
MTLYRQILLLLNASFLAILVAVYSIELTTSREALAREMENDVQNAATALGLSLSPYLKQDDKAGVDTVLQSVFDGGYYRRMTLVWHKDGQRLVKENALQVFDVPDWFLALPLFPTVKQEQVLTSGWLQLATLTIEAHPGVAYQELWRTGLHLLWTLGLLYLVVLLLVWRGLRYLMKPLKQVARQARRISQRRFDEALTLPRTAELKQVVVAINDMSARLKSMFESQDQQIRALRLSTQVDAVSGLANGTQLRLHLKAWLAEGGVGGLCIADLRWLSSLYRQEGFADRDAVVREIAERLQGQCLAGGRNLVARLGETEFAVLRASLTGSELAAWFEQLRQVLASVTLSHHQDADSWALALVCGGGQVSVSELLAEADNALHVAWQQEPHVHVFDEARDGHLCQSTWKEALSQAISSRDFQLQFHPACSLQDHQELHREWLASLALNGQQFAAGVFLPFIEQFGLGREFDLVILRSLADQGLMSVEREHVLNLSLDSLREPADMLAQLDQLPLDIHIGVELSEDLVLAEPDASQLLVRELKRRHIGFGVDHVGRQLKSLSYLHQLAPDHIKLDQSLACYDREHLEQQEVVRALVRIAKGLGIQVIATKVESEDELALLSQMGLDGYQGFIHPPQSSEQ